MEHPHQCPYCPVRFALKNEVDWHIHDEHPTAHLDYVSHSEHDRAEAEKALRTPTADR